MDTNQRFYVLDAFRGIAALLVCLYHMPKLSFLTDNAFITRAGVFVDLFFILSGFVIYHNYKNRLSNKSSVKLFLKKRFKRLIPLHLYTLLVVLLLEIFKLLLYPKIELTDAPFEINTITSFWSQLFLLNSTPLFMGFNWNFPNWSISAEIIAYLVFAILSMLLFRTKKTTLSISLVIIVLGYVFYYLKYDLLNPLIDFNFSFIRGIMGFSVGICIYLMRFQFLSFLKSISETLYTIFEIASIFMVVYLVSQLDTLQNYFYVYHLAFGLLLLIFSFEKGIISKLLRFQVFQNLGLWSYSIYLNHAFLIILFNKIIVKMMKIEGSISILFEVLFLVLLCYYSSITYRYIEKRFYKPNALVKNSE